MSCDFGHIFKATKVKVSVIVGTWEALPNAKFCIKMLKGIYPFEANITKSERPYPEPNLVKMLKGYTLLGKFISKITNFGDFWDCKPTF